MSAAEASFTKYQAQFAQIEARVEAYRHEILWPKYRQFRPSSSWLTMTERKRLDSFRAQQFKVGDRMLILLDRVGGRSFRSHAPWHWVMTELTFADAVTTGAMSVVPPSPYGYSDREVALWAGAMP